MKNRILLILLCISAYSFAGNYITEDYIWTSPSKNSSESMPCGGNSIGMNVWVENGDLGGCFLTRDIHGNKLFAKDRCNAEL